jgi:hypothetical protein
LVEDSAAPHPDRTMPTARDPAANQSGLLTVDELASRVRSLLPTLKPNQQNEPVLVGGLLSSAC